MKTFIMITLLSLLTSCASNYLEKVVKRMDNVSTKPQWASLANNMYVKDGHIYVVGYTTGEEDVRISALSRIADNNARYEISRYIKNEMGFFFQNVEEGTQGAELSTFYGTELSKSVSSQTKTSNRYYEKVLVTLPDGEKKVRTDVYSLTVISEKQLKKLVHQAFKQENRVSEEVKTMVAERLLRSIESF